MYINIYKIYKNTCLMQLCSIHNYLTITLLLEYNFISMKYINKQLWNYWFGHWKTNMKKNQAFTRMGKTLVFLPFPGSPSFLDLCPGVGLLELLESALVWDRAALASPLTDCVAAHCCQNLDTCIQYSWQCKESQNRQHFPLRNSNKSF